MPTESQWGIQTQRISTTCLKSPKSGEVEDEAVTPVTLQFGPAAKASLAGLDRVDLEAKFTSRACVMESSPAFM